MMNHRQIAEAYWRTNFPSEVATEDDPARFFADLVQQVEDQVSAVPAEHKDAAREIALADLVYLPPEPRTEDKPMQGTTRLGWENSARPHLPSSDHRPPGTGLVQCQRASRALATTSS